MAIMIPDRPPHPEVFTKSERQFWQELKDQLSDEFYVYHSLPYLRRDAVQGELDFLILHRTLGMLNVECKLRPPGGEHPRRPSRGPRHP